MAWKCLLVGVLAAGLAGCAKGPEPRYQGPDGEGRLEYVPGIGITRRGAQPIAAEQALFEQLTAAFNERRWQDAIVLSQQLSAAFPEGSRVVEALLLRVQARFELGRDTDEGLPKLVPLDRLLFVYFAPQDDPRLRELMARDASMRQYATDLRATEALDFVERLTPDALALYNSGQLEAALADCRTLITYYLPAQDLRQFRQRTAELTRDAAWLALAAREFDLTLEITTDLLAMNPSPGVKGDSLFARGHALRLNGAAALAAEAFESLYRTAGLRDTDTRWRAHGLLWTIDQTMATAKGPLYDLVPYERALEYLSEYELYMLENPGLSAKLRDQFVILAERAYDVMIRRDLNAAETYRRLGEPEAAQVYTANAKRWQDERENRIARLRGGS